MNFTKIINVNWQLKISSHERSKKKYYCRCFVSDRNYYEEIFSIVDDTEDLEDIVRDIFIDI